MRTLILTTMTGLLLASSAFADDRQLDGWKTYDQVYDACYEDHNAEACIVLIGYSDTWKNITDGKVIKKSFKEFGEEFKDFGKTIKGWFD